jgi:MazG family protein
MKRQPAINDLLKVMAKLRSPKGCPWDREQSHMSLRRHAIEEVYELIDAIEAHDDHEMAEELGDLLLQVVFHCQLARERGAFDFERVTRHLVHKLIRRHPHVFGTTKVKNVDEVWANWEKIKRAEKAGTKSERKSAFDGIPIHLPALLRAEKLSKKAHKVFADGRQAAGKNSKLKLSKPALARKLFALAAFAQSRGWSAEELLASEIKKQERQLREQEKQRAKSQKTD